MRDLVTDPVGSVGARSVTSLGVWAREGLPGRHQGHHSSLPSSCATRHQALLGSGPREGVPGDPSTDTCGRGHH